jgi:hypothetical protein
MSTSTSTITPPSWGTVAAVVAAGTILGIVLGGSSVILYQRRQKAADISTLQNVSDVDPTDEDAKAKDDGLSTYGKLIGNTPLIKLEMLSRALGCDIFAKVGWATAYTYSFVTSS